MITPRIILSDSAAASAEKSFWQARVEVVKVLQKSPGYNGKAASFSYKTEFHYLALAGSGELRGPGSTLRGEPGGSKSFGIGKEGERAAIAHFCAQFREKTGLAFNDWETLQKNGWSIVGATKTREPIVADLRKNGDLGGPTWAENQAAMREALESGYVTGKEELLTGIPEKREESSLGSEDRIKSPGDFSDHLKAYRVRRAARAPLASSSSSYADSSESSLQRLRAGRRSITGGKPRRRTSYTAEEDKVEALLQRLRAGRSRVKEILADRRGEDEEERG